MNIGRLMARAQATLAETLKLSSTEARIEAQCLMQQVLGRSRAYLLAHPERGLGDHEQARYDELLLRRLAGEPVAYILGEREFYGLTFKVTPDTLIPRPETELLVELALQRLPSDETTSQSTRPSKNDGQVAGYPGLAATLSRLRERGWGRGREFRVLDLGTGSGAIAIAIAHASPSAEVLACDASHAALDVARENAQRLGIANAVFVQSDWFTALGERRFDLIVSNPPYIEVGDPHLQCGDVRFEPPSALSSGDDGLHDIRRIVVEAPAHLQPGGWLLLEHGYDQAAKVRELLHEAGLAEVFSAPDMAGIERVSGGRA